MRKINFENIDVNETYFHFTEKSNLKSIRKYGLKAQIGDASKFVGDKSRVCLSRGIRGLLGIKNSFIWEFEHAKICDIPEGYRKYFDITDFSSTEIIPKEIVYEALKRKFENEVYLVVDAKEGEDFLSEEIGGLGSDYDIKGIEGHDISSKKISELSLPNVGNAWETIQYVYNDFIKKNQDMEKIIRMMNSNLDEMITYFKNKELEQSDFTPTKEKFTLKQKVARFLQKNNLFMNLRFVGNFVHNQLDVLSQGKEKINEEDVKQEKRISSREAFENWVSNNGELKQYNKSSQDISITSNLESEYDAVEELNKIINQMNSTDKSER